MGRLRVIAGEFRGRRIEVPQGPVRPTPDRVREALFAILAAVTPGARVLDAFAGSGALGIEALSRGAREAVFVEIDRGTVRVLRANLAALGLEGRARVVEGDAVRTLRRGAVRGPFDLALADPPYRGPLAREFLAAIAASGAAGRVGHVVLERDCREPVLETERGLRLTRSARYGGTRLDFYLPVEPT